MAGRGAVRATMLLGVALALGVSSAAAQADTVRVERADYFQATDVHGSRDSFVSVEATGESASSSLLADIGGQSVPMTPFSHDGGYVEHRALVRVDSRPDDVRVTSPDGGADTLAVEDWAGGPLPQKPPGYVRDFITRYVDPQEASAKLRSLAAEFPDLAQVYDLPNKTSGYQRHAQAVVGVNPAYAGATGALDPANAASAVVVTSKEWGQQGGNDVSIRLDAPAASDQPLYVSVSGDAVVVELATDASGAVTSTARQVVDALNSKVEANALLSAATYRANAGNGIAAATSRTALSDFLDAPQSYPRGPQTVPMLRIGRHRDGTRPGVLLFAGMHGDEWTTPLAVLETAERLLRNDATDAHTRDLLDQLDIFVVPVVDPDGAAYSLYDSPAAGAKNMAESCAAAASSATDPLQRDSWGVDIASNFSIGSLFDGYAGASIACTDPAYAGPFEFSEPESRNLQWVASTFSNLWFAMGLRSSGGWLTWPPGAQKYGDRSTLPHGPAAAEAWYRSTAEAITAGYESTRGNVLLPQRTGAGIDVRASAAGNPLDDLYFTHGILGFELALGPDRFTGTGTQQAPVGKQPPYTVEGHDEAWEGADAIGGLLDAALEEARDTQPPTVQATPAGPAFSRTPVAVSFTSSEPAEIHYTLDGSTPTLGSPVWAPVGRRSAADPLLLDHTTTVKWMASDIRGRQTAVSSAHYVVDDVAPTTAADIAPAPIGGWYRDPTVTLHATDDDAGVDVIQYRLDGGPWTTYSDPFQVTGDGSHTLVYRSSDKAGNVEDDRVQPIRIDTATPATTASSSPAASGGWYQRPVVTLEATDAGAGVDATEYRLDDGAWTTYSAPFEVTGDGPHTLAYRSSDKAGNVESEHSEPIRIDTAAPTTTAHVDSAPVGGWAPDATVTLHATDDGAGVAGTDYRLDGGTWQAYTGPIRVVGDGVRTVDYRSRDATGNVEPAQTLTLALDAAAPTTTAGIFAAEHGGWYRRAIVVLKSVDRGAGVAATEYRLDGGPWNPYLNPVLVTGDGRHTVEYRSRDALGHVEDPRSLALALDATDPAIALSVPPVARFARGASARARYACTDAGSGIAACTGTQASGARLDTGTAGRHVLVVTARDVAGNVHTRRWSYTVVGRAPKLRVALRDRHALRNGLRLALTSPLAGRVRVAGVLEPRGGGRGVGLRPARATLAPGNASLVTLRLQRGGAKRLRGHALVASLRLESHSAALNRTQAKRLTVRP